MRRTVGRSVVLGVVVPAGAGAGGTGAHWGSVGLAGWVVGWSARQDWFGRVWIKRDLSCRLAQQCNVEAVWSLGLRLGLRSGALRNWERQRVAVHEKGSARVS